MVMGMVLVKVVVIVAVVVAVVVVVVVVVVGCLLFFHGVFVLFLDGERRPPEK